MTKTTFRVVTAGMIGDEIIRASKIGEAFSYEGVSWRNSVDGCDSDGHGRVFLDCDSDEIADFIEEQLDADDRVISYDRI